MAHCFPRRVPTICSKTWSRPRAREHPPPVNGVAGRRPGCAPAKEILLSSLDKGWHFHPSIMKEIIVKARLNYTAFALLLLALVAAAFSRGDGRDPDRHDRDRDRPDNRFD